MKAVVLEQNADQIISIPETFEATKIRIVKPARREVVEDLILDPDTMSVLKVERQQVMASDVFCNRQSWQCLQEYSNRMKRHERSSTLPPFAQQINAMTVKDGYIPHDLSHQDMTGINVQRQAEYILRAPFMKAIAAHPDFCDLPGFEVPKRIMKENNGHPQSGAERRKFIPEEQNPDHEWFTG